MNRQKFPFRSFVTPEVLDRMVEDFAVANAQTILDLAEPGVMGSVVPQQQTPAGWGVTLPQLVAYTRGNAQRIATGAPGVVDISKSGDTAAGEFGAPTVDSEEAPMANLPAIPAGKEMWISVGVMFTHAESAMVTDGYARDVPSRLLDSFAFRVVYGAIAAAGAGIRPSKAAFDGGVLLCDVLLDSASAAVTQNQIDTGRMDVFRWRRDAFQNATIDLGAVPTNGTKNLFLPGYAAITPAGSYAALFSWDPNHAAGVALTRVFAVAPRQMQDGLPRTGNTVIEVSPYADFSDPAKILSITILQANESAEATAFLELDIAAFQYCWARVKEAGGHQNVTLEIEYVVTRRP
jgi:hypothetical protein